MITLLTFAAFFSLATADVAPAAGRFVKLTDSFHVLEGSGDGPHVAAVVTDEGVLLVNPPGERGLPAFQEALRRLTTRPVRWIVTTDHHKARDAHLAPWIRQGAAVFMSRNQGELAAPPPEPEPVRPADRVEIRLPKREDARVEEGAGLRFEFGGGMRLFPAGVEIRLLAFERGARTAADVVVVLPAERVLYTGDLFVPGGLPLIDAAEGRGHALGWIDGMRRVIDAVPLLRSAMPQPKPDDASSEEDKTLEETVIVVPARGPRSNLLEMKTAVETAQRLRQEVERAIRGGRTRDNLLSVPSLGSYRNMKNFESYALLLFDALPGK